MLITNGTADRSPGKALAAADVRLASCVRCLGRRADLRASAWTGRTCDQQLALSARRGLEARNERTSGRVNAKQHHSWKWESASDVGSSGARPAAQEARNRRRGVERKRRASLSTVKSYAVHAHPPHHLSPHLSFLVRRTSAAKGPAPSSLHRCTLSRSPAPLPSCLCLSCLRVSAEVYALFASARRRRSPHASTALHVTSQSTDHLLFIVLHGFLTRGLLLHVQ